SPEGWAKLQAELDRIYADFVGKVSTGRELEPAAVEAIAKGQVWSGADAEANGLVDRLGGLNEAVRAASELLGLAPEAPVVLVPYPEHREGLEALIESFTGSKGLVGTVIEIAAALQDIRAMLGLDRLAQNEPRLEMTPLRTAP